MKKYERKYLIKELPDLKQLVPIHYERYFLYLGKFIKIRAQQKDRNYRLEIYIGKKKFKKKIKQKQFYKITKNCARKIVRDKYKVTDRISIKLYKGNYYGLNIADIEFNSKDEMKNADIPQWLGTDITDTVLGKDGTIIYLTREKLLELLSKEKYNLKIKEI